MHIESVRFGKPRKKRREKLEELERKQRKKLLESNLYFTQ